MAYDSIGMLRKISDAGLTATGNFPANPGLQIDGTPLGTASLFIRVHVPQATGTSPTLDATIQESNDGTTWQTVVTFAQIIAAGEYRRKVQTNRKYIRVACTVAGTTPNFGIVQVGVETGSEYKG